MNHCRPPTLATWMALPSSPRFAQPISRLLSFRVAAATLPREIIRMRVDDIINLLAVPGTDEPLALSEDGTRLESSDGVVFNVQNGVPILLTEEDKAVFRNVLETSGQAMAAEYDAMPDDVDAWQPAPDRPFPPLGLPTDIIDAGYSRKGDTTRILSVGGGPTRNSPKDINLNIAPFRGVDIVGSALRLPFHTGVVDGIWCNAVLEHIADFARAIAEMVRVTEPGGMVLVQVPFMQPVHGYPSDFQRFTADGLAFHMRELEIIAKGEAVGGSYTTWQILKTYLDGPGQKTLPRWIRGLARRTLLPALQKSSMERTDLTLPDDLRLLSSVVYCFGRKRN